MNVSPGGGGAGRLQPSRGVLAVLVDGGDEGWQHGEPFPGPGVHAGLGPRFLLLVLDVAAADGAGNGPWPPAGRLVQCPLSEVEVEPPDGRQDSGARLSVLDALLPPGSDVGGQLQRADAWVVVFQVFPEPQAQRRGQAGEGAVVDTGLAFAQVVHEQVADGPAGQIVAVDELGGGELPGEPGVDYSDRDRRTGWKYPGCVQELVEERGVHASPVVVYPHEALQQLHAVAGGDVGDRPALGGHDHGDPLDRRAEHGCGEAAGLRQFPQSRDPGGVAGPAHFPPELARGSGGQQPGQARAQDVAADQLDQAAAERRAAALARHRVAGAAEVGQKLIPPVSPPVGACPGRFPAFLPRRPRVQPEPVKDLQHGPLPPVLSLRFLGREGRGEHPSHHREPVRGSCVPRRRDRPRRELPITARASAPSCRAAATGGAATVTSGLFRTARPGS
ncbi:hypothetical protein [Candidatus Mycobacterium methanotrophicum]|uniref:Uncharacterized protein n=1 Tax=Candidatus Mycobacterium methanotrophicum TaxID=2943498 RepID=A0ABY4QH86_9MYCO|nr:hypothetical protein [Candidatus Mycobacterium methanotrophicum]UQX09889.1 hypothetical protein M5I08_16720 [Candidatus Mycobacterium methanotrophicum]